MRLRRARRLNIQRLAPSLTRVRLLGRAQAEGFEAQWTIRVAHRWQFTMSEMAFSFKVDRNDWSMLRYAADTKHPGSPYVLNPTAGGYQTIDGKLTRKWLVEELLRKK